MDGIGKSENGGVLSVTSQCVTSKEVESAVHRRLSPRLQKLPQNKRPFYGTPKRPLDNPSLEIVQKKVKLAPPRQASLPVLVPKDTSAPKGGNHGCSSDDTTARVGSLDIIVDPSMHAKLKETLRMFNTHFLHFVQEEEKRCKKDEVNGDNGPSPKKGNPGDTDVKRPSKRPDLKAISKMLETDTILHPKKRFGHLPGIDVGCQFFSRAEMVAVGLHGHWLFGIDYMSKTSRKLVGCIKLFGEIKEDYNGYSFPLAVSIVLSGQYEDDLDNSEDVIYTGQGGNDLLGNKRQIKDQILTRGNLALKNSMEQSVPVRFIRGHKSTNSYSGKVYTYDGLYKVAEYWAEKGVSGFTVFKYRLSRIDGQPTLTTNQVLFARGCTYKVASELPGLVSSDISNGQEDICIPATNLYDDPAVPPGEFTYSKYIQVAENVKLPPEAPGCNCKEKCTNPKTCSCAQLNGSDFPYVAKNGGRLIEARDVVYECGPNCGCGPSCVNRTSQRGPKYRLEVFRTANKGWAVRSWDSIPSGAPICEYVGVLKRSDELDNVSENDYIFEIDCLQTMKEIGGRERRLRDVYVPTSNHLRKGSENAPEFSIDAGSIGNVARFINHSCEPNLFVQCVFTSHHDVRLARVVLFASDNIPPLQELTYDYGYALNSVRGSDGKIKKLACHCGAATCRKRLF